MEDESERPQVLIVEDDADLAEEFIAPFFRPYWDVVLAHNLWQAKESLDDIGELRLALVDLNIPGGRPFDGELPGGGFEVIEWVRDRFPRALVVVVTAHTDQRLINTAQRLGAEFMAKTDYAQNLEALVARIRSDESTARAEAYARHLQREHDLTDRQAEIVLLAISGRCNVEIAQDLAISINTLKVHVRDILRATNANRLADLARRYWREQAG